MLSVAGKTAHWDRRTDSTRQMSTIRIASLMASGHGGPDPEYLDELQKSSSRKRLGAYRVALLACFSTVSHVRDLLRSRDRSQFVSVGLVLGVKEDEPTCGHPA